MRRLLYDVWFLLTREHPMAPVVFLGLWLVIALLSILRGDGVSLP